MRKIIVNSMISLDGVLQAPGGPDEDTEGGFAYGGWSAPFGDDEFNAHFGLLAGPTDLLLGRKTYDIFAGYWPQHAEFWPGINEVAKYVVSHSAGTSEWNTTFLGGGSRGSSDGNGYSNDSSVVDDIRALKAGDGGDLTVWGSGELIQTLLENDLVDEFALVTYPVTLGGGKRLWGSGTFAGTFTVTDAAVTPAGVVFARYTRAGDVVTGTVGPE